MKRFVPCKTPGRLNFILTIIRNIISRSCEAKTLNKIFQEN